MRPDGEDDIEHEPLMKFVPEMETAVPTVPELGVKASVGCGTV